MKEISLKELLEAGCHFGHRKERWHPKAASFIYQTKEGIHIIDLVKTRSALTQAAEYVKGLGQERKTILFVATKRQAKGVVSEAAKRAGVAYLTSRWIGGFITNWEEVKKNIDKLNRFYKEKADGSWQKFPKHEIVKLEKILRKLEIVYKGVIDLTAPPAAVFIVDAKKEIACLAEAIRRGVKTVAIVDTNTDPSALDFPIPANDDAVGSIQYIVNYLAEAYLEGRKLAEKQEGKKEERIDDPSTTLGTGRQQITKSEEKEIKEEKKIGVKKETPKKRGRPKKQKTDNS